MKPSSRAVLQLLEWSGHRGVTQQDAIREARCYRLAARVADLRADGYRITSELVTGDGVRFSRYRLITEPEQIEAGL